MRKLFLILVLTVVAAYPLTLLFLSKSTVLQLSRPVTVVGVRTPVEVLAVNPHGVRRFEASIEQGGENFPLVQKEVPAIRWQFRRKGENPRTFTFEAGTHSAPKLKDGKAVLHILAVANNLRAKTDRIDLDVEVNTKPPTISLDRRSHGLVLGGTDLAVFAVGGYVTESGVRVGKHTFRSFPHTGNRRICFFAAAHDLEPGEIPEVFARNPSGAEVTEKLRGEVPRRNFRQRQIRVDDAFLKKVHAELDPGGTGDPVARFTKVNNDMRQANNQALSELRLRTEERILWNGPFRQLPHSVAEAQYCDYRTYFVGGQSVDRQVHLGFDLAGLSRMPVNAANDGRVIFAAPLGIYGNAIVIDHGVGIQSLYAHLSEIQVKTGQMLKKGDTIGKTGSTGLAAGDHLHFSIQVDGVMVDPNQWWDPKWIENRIQNRLR